MKLFVVLEILIAEANVKITIYTILWKEIAKSNYLTDQIYFQIHILYHIKWVGGTLFLKHSNHVWVGNSTYVITKWHIVRETTQLSRLHTEGVASTLHQPLHYVSHFKLKSKVVLQINRTCEFKITAHLLFSQTGRCLFGGVQIMITPIHLSIVFIRFF